MPVKVAEPLHADEIHVWQLARPRAAGRAPLLALLAVYLGVAAEQVRLVEGEYGRPALHASHASTLAFNWSHSGELALVALARGIVPGIDVELPRRRPGALDIARRFFTTEEASWLATLPPAQCDAAFLQLWTAREAVLKAVGRGIAFGLDKLAFRRAGDWLALQALHGDDVAAWQVHDITLPDGAHAALAWRGPPRRLRCYRLADGG